MMVLTVMFFVFSCVLSLSPADLAEAKRRTSRFCLTRRTTLTHRSLPDGADHRDDRHHQILPRPLPGAREGFNGMVIKSLRGKGKSIEINKLNKITALFMLVTTGLWPR